MEAVQSLVSIPALIEAVRNNLGRALLTFLITVTLAVLAIIFMPREYGSEAKIFVRLGRESVSLDPTATTGSRISVLESRETEVNSVRDMLHSRNLLETVVDRLGPGVVLGDEAIPEELNELDDAVANDDYSRSPRQRAIKALMKDLKIDSARKSSVISLEVKAATPELAQRILQVYLDSYKAMHTAAHQTPKSNKFFADQATKLKNQWHTAMQRLQQAREDAGIVSIDGSRDALKTQIGNTETGLMDTKNSLLSSEARLKMLEAMARNPLDLPRIRDDLMTTRADMAALAAQHNALEWQLKQLLAKIEKMNADEITLRQLDREVAVSGANYSQYRELFEQTRIEADLLTEKFTNVKVVQRPSLIPKAVSASRSMIAAAGLLAGLTGAFLVALLSELYFKKNDSLSTTSDASESSGLTPPTQLDHGLLENASL